MKKRLLFAFLVTFALSMQAQHFEWVNGYNVQIPTVAFGVGDCIIVGSVTDSVGNLYILGRALGESEWGTGANAERMAQDLPDIIPNSANVVLFAKISPDGELLWRKVITSIYASQSPYDIKMVGDSAFACLVEVHLPTEGCFVYWFDTLLTGRMDYPISSMYVRNPFRTAFIMFDFDGNIIEQHFLHTTYTDSASNDYVMYYNDDPTPWYESYYFRSPSFDIDSMGNIYVSRIANDWLADTLTAAGGGIHGVKFWVDNRQVGEYTINSTPMYWYPQIVKFSPHFDTMLDCRYVVQKNNNLEYQWMETHTNIDKYGNVYFMTHELAQSGMYQEDSIFIDTTQNIVFGRTDMAIIKDFLVQFNPDLTPNWVITLNDSLTGVGYSSSLCFSGIDFDYDSNLFFLSATTGRTTFSDTVNYYSILTYQGMPLNIKDGGFFVSFDISNSTPNLHSYGSVPAVMHSYAEGSCPVPLKNLVSVKDNRVYMQSKYMGGVRFPGQTIQFDQWNYWGMGLLIFDYQGNIIEGLDYSSSNGSPGGIVHLDSIVYITGVVSFDDVDFGNVHFQVDGKEYAFIAKYVDPAFAQLYKGDTGNVSITLTPDVGVFTAYPNPFKQRVNIRIENTELKAVNGRVTAMLTDLTGRSEEVPLTIEGSGSYVLDLTARPQASYFLTLTTADGRQHTVRLLKQSDRFGTN